jgi:hypothetical protein
MECACPKSTSNQARSYPATITTVRICWSPITDLDIRSDVEGMGPMPGKFKSRDVKWLPGGYPDTLTNEGKSPARFVTVEV